MKSDLPFTLMHASEYPCGNKYGTTLGFSVVGCLVIICNVLWMTMDLYIFYAYIYAENTLDIFQLNITDQMGICNIKIVSDV